MREFEIEAAPKKDGNKDAYGARDAEWGKRFFHLTDPDGHELSFAWPLR